MWQLVGGVFLGWALGSNDAANVYGTAVASRMVRFRTAAVLASLFVMVGAVLLGSEGIETYSKLSSTNVDSAFVVTGAAALTVAAMTWLHLPVSTSQAVVGALLMLWTTEGATAENYRALYKVVICWVGTPLGAAGIAMVLYPLLGKLLNRLHLSMFAYDRVLRIGLLVAGAYSAFALGANNVANVIAPFVGDGPGQLDPLIGCLIGGGTIALGIVTFSRHVMMTVGRGLVKLDAFSAFIVVVAEGITVHIYAEVGVPVSTSQAVIGAVLGVGLLKGVQTIRWGMLWRIVAAWICTPVAAFLTAYGLHYLMQSFGG